MSDIRNDQQDLAVLRAEADQLIASLWDIFRGNGDLWVDRLDQMTVAFMDHDEDPCRTVGALAQVGFLTMLISRGAD
jgi:hypothetical protein